MLLRFSRFKAKDFLVVYKQSETIPRNVLETPMGWACWRLRILPPQLHRVNATPYTMINRDRKSLRWMTQREGKNLVGVVLEQIGAWSYQTNRTFADDSASCFIKLIGTTQQIIYIPLDVMVVVWATGMINLLSRARATHQPAWDITNRQPR